MTSLARAAAGLALLFGTAFAPAALAAQQPPAAPPAAGGPLRLSLDDALTLGERQSESVRIAESGVLRARGQYGQALSQALPQLNASGAYQRTVQSQFVELQNRAGSPAPTQPVPPLPESLCTPLVPNNATPDQRAAAFAQALSCSQVQSGSAGGLGDITRVFANPNTIILGVTGSQTLFAGGRIRAGLTSAQAGRRSADIGVTGARTQVRLDVATAYFDATLADRLVTIAESSLVQTERTFRQTALGREVGRVSEFDLLRSRVARDNQRPQLVTARGTRDQAYLRLRQVLNIPLDQPLALTTALPMAAGATERAVFDATRAPLAAAGLEQPAPGARPAPRDSTARTTNARGDTVQVRTVQVNPAEVLGDDPRVRAAVAEVVARGDTSGRARVTSRQSRENVTVQRSLLTVARAQRLPAVSLSGNYQRFAYPNGNGLVFPNSLNQFVPNFTASLGVSLPVFTGGRIRGDILVAQANLREAEATARQVEQLSSLDARLAITQLEQAEASFLASAGTAEQAARAYGIAEVRFREGVATQVELADSRLLLQQAQANAAQAARDREVSRLRLALLRDLPLAQVQGGAQSGAGGFGGRQGGGAGQQSVPNQQGGSVTGGTTGAAAGGAAGAGTAGGAAGGTPGTGTGTAGGPQ